MIVNFVRRQPGVAERLLRLDLPKAVAMEVDAVRRLLRELFGVDCSRAEIETHLRGAHAPGG